MSDAAAVAPPVAAPTHHTFEFKGDGGEFFRIWIVNIVLTVLTLGIYSAWAKVRTTRYFYGNTFLAGHPFDYHASPVRILIGRLIATALLLGYSITVQIQPLLVIAWSILILFVTPWLVVSSLRFSARNSSYRNVRFNFVGTMGQAAWVYIAWPIFTFLTLFTTVPLARRARDYFYVNNHTFGGKPFHTEFEGIAIYGIYFLAFGLFLALTMATGGLVVASMFAIGLDPAQFKPGTQAPIGFILVIFVAYAAFLFGAQMIVQAMQTLIFNLAVRNTVLDGRHKLTTILSPVQMAWIGVTNLLLVFVTLGFYYPWARVRVMRYQMEHMGIDATTGLDEFTSEAIATQGAIGEEIAGFFDLGIGL